MPEISHQQVRDYIQKAVDGLLNDNDNAILTKHLATCTDCRAYATELHSLEVNLNYFMNKRWNKEYKYKGPDPRIIQTQSRRRKMQRNLASFAGMSILVGILIIALVNAINWFLPQQEVGSSFIASPTVDFSSDNLTPSPDSALEINSTVELPSGWLAFTSYLESDCEIYLVKADGSELIDISNNPACDSNPVWSPDGQRLAFLSHRDGSSQIFILNVNRMEISQLTEASQFTSVSFCSESVDVDLNQREGFSELSWSPDGEFLAATLAMNLDGNMFEPLFLIALDGSGIVQLTEGNDVYPQWSHDGTKIGFIRLADCNGGGHDIFVINRDGSGLINLTASPAYESSTFTWSPDGKQIAYFSTIVMDNNQSYTNIELVSADGKNRETLLEIDTGQNPNGGEITWSPDRKQLAYVNPHQSNDGQIHLLDIESQETKLITTTSDHYFNLSWSPDSRWLSFAAGLDKTALFILGVRSALQSEGGALPIPITTSQLGQVYGPQWQPSP